MVLHFYRTLVREALPHRLSYPCTECVRGRLGLYRELSTLKVYVAGDLKDALNATCLVDGVVLKESHAFHESVAKLPWTKLRSFNAWRGQVP